MIAKVSFVTIHLEQCIIIILNNILYTGAQEVNALKVRCESLINGCEWVGELSSLKNHLENCDFALVPCPNKCDIKKLLRKNLNNHIVECPRRQYKCPHCDEIGRYEERTTNHLDNCPKVEVQCPNIRCKDKILRCEISAHHSVCVFQQVQCKFKEFGCKVKMRRKDMKAHEKDDQLHLQITKEKVLELTKAVNSLRTTTSPIVFKFLQFNKHKEENKPFYSLPFYSSRNGYKFSISVNAVGEEDADEDDADKDDDDSTISVYAHLEKGEYDDTLTWPFRGSVTVELLNQLEDRNHKKYTIDFPTDNDVSGRVTSGIGNIGWGFSNFIRHTQLGHRRRINCQYLKDDTLVFRASVEIPDYKPWLESTV